jgi:pyrimidine-specific ribonucleoside hydrolase
MKRILLLLSIILLSQTLLSHPWKPKHYVIIDTDAGLDDFKAVCMLLASPDTRVLAITVSPGALPAEAAYIKIKSLLKSFYHEGIPVGINRTSKFKSPAFAAAMEAEWGNEEGISASGASDATAVIERVLTAEKTRISFISLGSLSTVSAASEKSAIFRSQVKEIIWSGSPYEKKSFNYSADSKAAETVIEGSVPLVAVYGNNSEPFYTNELIETLAKGTGRYITKVYSLLTSKTREHNFLFTASDELVAFYLHYSRFFSNRTEGKITFVKPDITDALRLRTDSILNGMTVEKNQVIKRFPHEPSFYFADIRPFVTEIISKHGEEEWVSGVIANELHRHLGVFAIIGVKMGIRAREYYNTGVDEFEVISDAGSIPPLSCLNDGIQVSTGATPGHGLLTVRNADPQTPSAIFSYLGNRIRLTLKPEIAKKISAELKEINFVYGLDSNIYWELVRKNSIKYWRDLDRHDIFTIDVLN